MFDLFRKKVADQLTRPSVSMIRARTRALIRFANDAESADLRGVVPNQTARRTKDEWRRAMSSGETQLASSIAAAVSGDLSLHAIVNDVIQPILEEAVVVSETARRAILRAVSTAGGG